MLWTASALQPGELAAPVLGAVQRGPDADPLRRPVHVHGLGRGGRRQENVGGHRNRAQGPAAAQDLAVQRRQRAPRQGGQRRERPAVRHALLHHQLRRLPAGLVSARRVVVGSSPELPCIFVPLSTSSCLFLCWQDGFTSLQRNRTALLV